MLREKRRRLPVYDRKGNLRRAKLAQGPRSRASEVTLLSLHFAGSTCERQGCLGRNHDAEYAQNHPLACTSFPSYPCALISQPLLYSFLPRRYYPCITLPPHRAAVAPSLQLQANQLHSPAAPKPSRAAPRPPRKISQQCRPAISARRWVPSLGQGRERMALWLQVRPLAAHSLVNPCLLTLVVR